MITRLCEGCSTMVVVEEQAGLGTDESGSVLPFSATMDNDLHRVWQLIHDLSDQLILNQKITASLQSQDNNLKVRTLYVLARQTNDHNS